jgi:hypothetical protein
MRVAAVVGMLIGLGLAAPGMGGDAITVRDQDPGHLWNRLHDALFTRVAPDGVRFGATELDILYWDNTRHLLTPPSQQLALAVLDEFIREHGERLVRDPARRALLQRDLWALFDWSARLPYLASRNEVEPAARLELQRRLAVVIRRLALSPDEIAGLPDNLPAEGPRSTAGWVLVGRNDGSTTAPEHHEDFGGRSVFYVWVRLPEGEAATTQYLKTLREFTPALVYLAGQHPDLPLRTQKPAVNPAMPQFPAGTQWALVRRLILIDHADQLRVSPVVESLQIRRYISIPEAPRDFDAQRNSQTVAEWQLDRARLPALRAVRADERELQGVHFRSMGVDVFEGNSAENWKQHHDRLLGTTLRTCMMCHHARGILSVNSYVSFGNAANPLEPSTPEREAAEAIAWKAKQYSWGLLNGLWKQQGATCSVTDRY